MTITCDQALPVELTGFMARLDGTSALLNWKTASETNNSGFAVEHRTPGSSGFSSRGWTDGAGTTLEAQGYTFSVAGLTPGTHAFRLRQVDLDGSEEFSPVVELTVTAVGADIRVVTASDGRESVLLTVGESQSVSVDAFDLLGRRVASVFEGEVGTDETLRLSLPTGLASGAYFVYVKGERFAETAQVRIVR